MAKHNLRVEINSNNEVLIFNDSHPNQDGSPFILQPYDPETAKPFTSSDNAKTWADARVNHYHAVVEAADIKFAEEKAAAEAEAAAAAEEEASKAAEAEEEVSPTE